MSVRVTDLHEKRHATSGTVWKLLLGSMMEVYRYKRDVPCRGGVSLTYSNISFGAGTH